MRRRSGRLEDGCPTCGGGLARVAEESPFWECGDDRECGHWFRLRDGKLRRCLTPADREWIEANIRLAWKAARQNRDTRIDFDTAVEAAFEAVVEALLTFDPKLNIQRSTHVMAACRWAINDRVRTVMGVDKRGKFRKSTTNFTDYAALSPAGSSGFDPADEGRSAPESAAEVRELLSALPRSWAAIVSARMAGGTLREVGKEFGISHERAGQIERSALASMRRHLARQGVFSRVV